MREHASERAVRLNLNKPHLYWGRHTKRWQFFRLGTVSYEEQVKLLRWRDEFTERYTPIQ